MAFDTRFRVQVQRLEEINAPINGVTKSFWYLETAGLSNDLRKQVVAAAGGSYDYPKLRAALMAIVPQVVKDEESSVFAGDRRHQALRRGQQAHKVNLVGDDAATADDEIAEDFAEDASGADGEDPEAEEASADALEHEAQVMITQAARKRATAEKARGFQRVETEAGRSARIAEMKKRMPCSECKSRGHLRFGHWHSDPECPYFKEKNAKTKTEKKTATGVYVVSQHHQEDDDEPTDDDEEAVYTVMMVDASECSMEGMAMSDTCCAKRVAGLEWMEQHMKWMDAQGVH